MANTSFETAYKRLNPAQREAVDTIEGPVMVIAGPGTGKTQILTLRIANILRKTDTPPEQILALTFTEGGARAMRERLLGYIGIAAYRVMISTFHEFAGRLISAYPDAYERVVGGRPASDIEKIEMLELLINEPEVKLLRPIGNPVFYVPHILRAIATMKKEYITPHTFSKLIAKEEKVLATIPKIHANGAHKGKIRSEYQKKEKSIAKNRELLAIYQKYEALLRARRAYDFEDMIVETVSALEKNDDMLRDLQETYLYILADEHQDVNGSQNRILELLASYHDRPNLFVVGDEKQAIFRFQGASLENFLYFENRFHNTRVIALTSNYRSGQKILDAAYSLIATKSGPQRDLRIPLVSENHRESAVEIRAFSHQAIEDTAVVGKISSLIASGVPPREIAVILRTNREVEALAGNLAAAGIGANASADSDILSHPITAAVCLLVDAAVQKGSEVALFRLIHAPYWGLKSHDLFTILAARTHDRPLSLILKDAKLQKSIGVTDVHKASRIATLLENARKMEVTEAPHRILQYLINESGLLRITIEQASLEGSRIIRRLYDEVEELTKRGEVTALSDVSTLLERRKMHNLPLSAPYVRTNENAVEVMTAHKAKGLEYRYVFVPHLTDSLWGGKKRTDYFEIPIVRHLTDVEFDELDDERRLLYVALTRAKEGLFISHAATNAEGVVFTPSRLIELIDPKLLSVVGTKKEEENFNPVEELMHSGQRTELDQSLLRTLLRERGLSATALNNYLASPWNYVYKNVLRIPEIQPLYLLKGTAIHNTLMRLTKYHTKNGKLPKEGDMLRFLREELGRLPLTKEEFVRLHSEGSAIIMAYREHLIRSLPKRTEEEKRIEVVLQTGDPDFPEVKLTGMLDRVDFDEAGNVIRVVDYKTGKYKSRGYIEGKTKNANGDYKRQLVFYALLLSLSENNRYACKEGLLSFVEPDAKGKIHEEAYTITDAEIEALKHDIIRVTLEIAHGAFLALPCDPQKCEYCELVAEIKA